MFADTNHHRHSQDERILILTVTLISQHYSNIGKYLQVCSRHTWGGLDDMEFMKKIGTYAIDFVTGKVYYGRSTYVREI